MGPRGHRPDRGGFRPLGGHAPDPGRAAGASGDRPLPQGRVDPSDRQPEASAGALAVPLWPVQRLDRAGDDGGGVLLGLDRGVGGLFRAAAGAAVHRGDAGHDLARQDRQDRVPGRALPFRGRPARGLCRQPQARGRDGRALSRPVHLCRAGDGLARQQQHRRIDLRPDAAGSAPRAALGGVRRRHRRDLGHDRALHPLQAAGHAAVRGRPGALGVPPPLGRPQRDHGRGARPPASRASAGRGSRPRSTPIWSTG